MKVKNNLDKIIYEQIINCLILGEYKMGQKILLNDLAERFEVSRTPVIQAVKLLANDGVLEAMSNGRISVPSFEPPQVKQICDVRLLIEKYSIKQILRTRRDNQHLIEQLEKMAVKCMDCYDKKDYLGLSKADLNYHRIMVSGAKNEYLDELYGKIQGKFIVVNYLVLPLEKREFRATVEEHFKLLDFIKNHDLTNAITFIEGHINNICDVIVNYE